MVPESEQVSAKVDIKASKGRRSTCKGTKAKANMIMVTSLCIGKCIYVHVDNRHIDIHLVTYNIEQ